MYKTYLEYINDNPRGYWFKAKMYGWGWTPVRWQGWCVTLLYVLLVLNFVLIREKDIPGNLNSGSNVLTFALLIVILTLLFIFVAYKTGEKPEWRWGSPKK